MNTPINLGIFQSDLEAAGYRISGLPTPVGSDEAANKLYVDLHSGGGGGGASGPGMGIDPKAAPFNASGSSTTTTTTGTNGSGATTINVASSATFLENHGIFIAGAGAAGVNYIGTVTGVPSGTSVTVTPATSTSVSAGTKVQHDDTAAWQLAITALTVTGGTIRDSSPGGFYRINGPLQDTGNANCRLKMPDVGASTMSPIGITIEGAMTPPAAFDSTFITSVISNQGTIFQSESVGGSIIGGYYNDGLYPDNFTNVNLSLHNVLFRTYDNPNQTAINLTNILQCNVHNVVVDTGTASQSVSQPTHAGVYAIKTPKNNNRSLCTMQNVALTGYYIGVQWNEHVEIIHLLMTQCLIGIEIPAAFHSLYGSRIGIFECPTGIKAAGAAVLNISELDTEWTDSGGWDNKVYDLDDAGNVLSGEIRWHSVKAFTGASGSFVKNGGTNLSVIELDTGVQTGRPVYVGTDARFTAISGGVKLEVRNVGTGTWLEATRYTNP